MESSFKFPFMEINFSTLSGYSLLLIIFVIFTAFVIFLKRKINNYLTKRKKLIELSENYERRRQCRNDLRYHYDWALDRGEKQSAMNIGREILRMDEELKELYADYQFLKEKGTFPLKKI